MLPLCARAGGRSADLGFCAERLGPSQPRRFSKSAPGWGFALRAGAKRAVEKRRDRKRFAAKLPLSMTGPQTGAEAAPDPNEEKLEATADPTPTPGAPRDADSGTSPAPEPAEQLTAEEQMALYEKELKESDWGHQPC